MDALLPVSDSVVEKAAVVSAGEDGGESFLEGRDASLDLEVCLLGSFTRKRFM